MKLTYHHNKTRGFADHGWLLANHTFSFAQYFDKNRMNFGALRVLNDDHVAAGAGFPTHPHNNMEIITIPLLGALEHQDSMGNKAVIRKGEVQVMSAGTGIMHSEYNHSEKEELNLLQIWVYPNKKNVEPRYDEVSLAEVRKENQLYQILSPNAADQGVWIHQNAWFYLGEYDQSSAEHYQLNDANNGVYLFVIEGNAKVGNQKLQKRDGLGVENTAAFEFSVSKGTQLLLMEVPMNKNIIV